MLFSPRAGAQAGAPVPTRHARVFSSGLVLVLIHPPVAACSPEDQHPARKSSCLLSCSLAAMQAANQGTAEQEIHDSCISLPPLPHCQLSKVVRKSEGLRLQISQFPTVGNR